jgi:arginyl-tRNA synthetase
MSLAKELGQKPPQVAAEIVQRLRIDDLCAPPQIAGPGFINLTMKAEWLQQQIQNIANDDRLGVPKPVQPKTFVIDFSSPNVAKSLHVGHLRSTIIGDALARLLRFLGHHVVTDNHLGDWGTQFGTLLYGYKNYVDAKAFAYDPVHELERLYKLVQGMKKSTNEESDEPSDDPIDRLCREETAKLHAGDPENVALWQMFMPHCLAELHDLYKCLDIHHDHELGESFYNPLLAAVVTSLEEKGLTQESRGAKVIAFDDESFSVVQKQDGAFTYMTTDLATIKYRVEQWSPDTILYVVDFRQGVHFQKLFSAARRWGYDKVGLHHISFGSVLGKDRKPMKTREGENVSLATLLNEAEARALNVYDNNMKERIERGEDVPQLSEEEKNRIATTVGLGAVKYADLCQNRTSDYVFDWDKMLAMDGNTATYMQYAYARNRSIFQKGEFDPVQLRRAVPKVILATPHERALALQLLRFEEALQSAANEFLPHLLTSYLWDLAKAYSGFFVNCPVLKAETPELRQSRLLLCDLTARVIQQTLGLLGIRTVERM